MDLAVIIHSERSSNAHRQQHRALDPHPVRIAKISSCLLATGELAIGRERGDFKIDVSLDDVGVSISEGVEL